MNPKKLSSLCVFSTVVLLQFATLGKAEDNFSMLEKTSSFRDRMIINGVWKFKPIKKEYQDLTWGFINVPGSWAKGLKRLPLPGVLMKKAKSPWPNIDLNNIYKAYYQRNIDIPASWKDKKILLNISRLSTDAIVFVNEKKCGSIKHPYGSLNLTGFVVPGQENKLKILVVAMPDSGDVEYFMDADNSYKKKAFLESRGIVGDVILEAIPRGSSIESLFIKTSIRKKELAVDVDLSGVKTPGKIKFTAIIKDAKGNVAKEFETIKKVGKGQKKVVLSWKWKNPKLWDFRQPNLYDLYLKAEGKNINDEFHQRFGFREFWISGKDFYLNGKKIRFRPTNVADFQKDVGGNIEAINNVMKGFLTSNFNMLEIWPENIYKRGICRFWEYYVNIADEMGMFIIYPSVTPTPYMKEWSKENKSLWEKRMTRDWKRIRNHPSILMIVCAGNRFGYKDDQNPERIGNSKKLPGSKNDVFWQKRTKIGKEAISIIKKYETTRPVISHHSTIGPIHSVNNFLDLLPLQEREEWLSAWAQKGDIPFYSCEFGAPLYMTMLRGRDSYIYAVHSEPFMTEYCSIYLGDKAYSLEVEEYREAIKKRYRGGFEYSRWGGWNPIDSAPAFQELCQLFIKNTWRSWRTWGISGGMVAYAYAQGWNFKAPGNKVKPASFDVANLGMFPKKMSAFSFYGMSNGGWPIMPAGKMLVKINNPKLAWIAGSPKAFTEKDHHFYSGDKIEKQIVLINDTRKKQNYEIHWRAYTNSKEIKRGECTGTIFPGENRFIPFEFTAPETKAKTDGKILMTAQMGNDTQEDLFDFRVYPKSTKNKNECVPFVFDLSGVTKNMLKNSGWNFKEWQGETGNRKVLIIGRNALGQKTACPGSLKEFLEKGGRIIILNQSPKWLERKIGFRTAKHVSRRFYPVPSLKNHPLIKGLDKDDFRDWRGAGTSAPNKWFTETDNSRKEWTYGWHWGNRGSISGVAIEKPHRSGLTPILEGEFDLAYTPLMELKCGDGLLIWSSLDLHDRGKNEPMVGIMLNRLIDYAYNFIPSKNHMNDTFYWGGKEGESILKLIGLKCKKTDKIPNVKSLLIIGKNVQCDDEKLEAFLALGGNILLFPRGTTSPPFGFKTHMVKSFVGSLNVPDWPECVGISKSDIRLRTDIPLALLHKSSLAQGKIGADGLLGRYSNGKGTAILVQLLPDMLDASTKTYFRLSAWRLTRMLSQLAVNLGGVFEMDEKLLSLLDGKAPPKVLMGGIDEKIFIDGEWLYKIEQKLAPDAAGNASQDLTNIGYEKGWANIDFDASDWKKETLPSLFRYWQGDWNSFSGSIWLRKKIIIPESWQGKDLILALGPIADMDKTYFNGSMIGGIGLETPRSYKIPRLYRIPSRLVKSGENLIAIRVFERSGEGGFKALPNTMILYKANDNNGFYHPDYRSNYEGGDNPYRYWRW